MHLHGRRERRGAPRIGGPFSATLRGTDSAGRFFQEPSEVANLSASGLLAIASRPVVPGERLLVVVRLAQAAARAAPTIAVRGVVVRVELRADGRYDVALKILRYHFLATSSG